MGGFRDDYFIYLVPTDTLTPFAHLII